MMKRSGEKKKKKFHNIGIRKKKAIRIITKKYTQTHEEHATKQTDLFQKNCSILQLINLQDTGPVRCR